MNVTQEILQSLPTSRDPWTVLQMAPSIIVDRENIAGVESGQQSSYVARGAGDYNNNVWAMDGVVITDPAAIGASPSYYDFDTFEEMQITVGGADVTIQTGGVALNMVTRRGGSRVTLGGRFYMVDSKFQAKNEDYVEKIQQEEPWFKGINMVNNNKDYGFNLGGPLVKDKAWLWGSYGVQNIKTLTVFGTSDDTMLVNYAAKMNLQIVPENRFEAFLHVGGKNKWGRSTSQANPSGLYQGGRYHFGSPILKFQDEHMFGDNMFVSLKYAFSDAGFNLTPMDDRDFEHVPAWDETVDTWISPDGVHGSDRYYVERPVNQFNILLNYFNDNLFGASHDFKFGFELADRNSYTESVYTGNMYYDWNLNYTLDVDLDGDGFADAPSDYTRDMKFFHYRRGYYRDFGVSALSLYASDTISFGRLNVILGLRVDQQRPRLNPATILAVTDNPAWDTITGGSQAAKDAFNTLLPGMELGAEYQDIKDLNGDRWGWTFWSPRVGLTWDVTGDGKTIAKVSFAMYGDFMGTSDYYQMPGGTDGYVQFYWDDDGDQVIQPLELYWGGTDSGTPGASYELYEPYNVFDANWNFQPANPDILDAAGWYYGWFANWATRNDLIAPYDELNPSYGSNRTTEFMLTLEREIFPDFAVTVNATYRRYDNFNWGLDFFVEDDTLPRDQWVKHYQSQDWYVVSPYNLPGTIDLTDVDTMWEDGDTGEAPDYDWYYRNEAYTEDGYEFNTAGYTAYDQYRRRPDRYNDYYGIDLIFVKRLSNNWMLNANVTWQHQAAHYGDQGYWSETNLWAVDGEPYAAEIGATSGKINQFTYSRWMLKAGGLYQLPYDFNISFTFLAREGWILEERVGYLDRRLPNPRSRSYTAYIDTFGTYRLPTFTKLDLRLEKVISLGDTGRIYLMADLFNAFNSKVETRRYQRDWGDYEVSSAGVPYFSESGSAYHLYEILNPRVIRLGVRFQF